MRVTNIFPTIRSTAFGDLLFVHGKTKNRTTAFCLPDKAGVLFFIPRSLCPLAVTVEVFSEDLSIRSVYTCEYFDTENESDVFLFDCSILPVGLYYLRPGFSALGNTYYGYKKTHGLILTTEQRPPDIQISVSDFHNESNPPVYGGVIYHIFVDRFCKYGRSSYKGDFVLIDDWENGMVEYPAYRGGPLKNNTFFGGTLDGISEKLPFLKSLGVTILYLSPIFESPSNHKYDTGDYAKIDDMFGGEAAFSDLLAACAKMGIGVILDGVFNHTGSDSRYFNRYGHYDSVGAYQSQKSPYYSWYDFQNYPDRYTCWWDIPILPRIHPDVPDCRAYFTGEKGIIPRYTELGILGFRLDVVDELSDSFVADIRRAMRQVNPRSYLLGEVWEDASNKIAYGQRKKYYLGEELDGVMNYPLRKGLIAYIMRGDTEALRYALTDIYENAPRRIRDAMMNFLGTHDTERILTVFADHDIAGLDNHALSVLRCSGEEKKVAKKRLISAYTVLSTLPGIPSVFYGDEAGMEGYHDPFNRMPYPWGKEDKTILRRFRKAGKIRHTEKVYETGDFHLLSLDQDMLIFARTDGEDACLTVFNRSDKRISIEFSKNAKDLLSEKKNDRFTVLPLTARIFSISRDTGFSVEKSK